MSAVQFAPEKHINLADFSDLLTFSLTDYDEEEDEHSIKHAFCGDNNNNQERKTMKGNCRTKGRRRSRKSRSRCLY